MSRPRLIALLLALATLAVYMPVAGHDFILYDDGDYVTQNAMVQAGWTLAGLKWAFTSFFSANWHPLTWLSHMTDCELFGLNPAGPHIVNAILHAANTVLVFFLWLQLTRNVSQRTSVSHPNESPVRASSRPVSATRLRLGRRLLRNKGLENETADESNAVPIVPENLWPAAFIAALFAVHPLHVESVAWVAERKDVLSTFFGLLALLCYARYAQSVHPRSSIFDSFRIRSFWWALIFFACGLMSKPMLVTLPFVMLLLDFWPLGRGGPLASVRGFAGPLAYARGSVGLVVEKIPFFVLTASSCVITYIAQNRGAVEPLANVSLAYRLADTPVVVATYLFKMVWPSHLAIIYPMRPVIPPAAVAISSAILILITVGGWIARKRRPYLLIGWLWFLGTLFPVLGLVKVGDAAMADRYMYIPSIGIFMAVAFGAWEMSRRFRFPQLLLPAAAILILAGFTVATEKQLAIWRNSETVFGHALKVTTDNVDVMLNYGVVLENAGKPMQAMEIYRRVEQLAPHAFPIGTAYLNMAYACADLGNILYYEGKPEQALEQYRRGLQFKPKSSTFHDRLGIVLASLDRFSEATNEFDQAMLLEPSNAAPHLHLGTALADHGDYAWATNEFADALRLAPGNPQPFVEWSKALLRQGRDQDAVAKLQQALQLDPDNFQTATFFARVLASDESPGIRDGAAALALAQKASALTDGRQPLVQDALGMAYAETGQFDQAEQAASDADQLAEAAGVKPEILTAMQERLQLYQKHQPWRESFKEKKEE